MTPSELITWLGGKTVEEQEKMTDTELMVYFAPMLTTTRPDLAAVQRSLAKQEVTKKRNRDDGTEDMYELARRTAEEMGLKLNL